MWWEQSSPGSGTIYARPHQLYVQFVEGVSYMFPGNYSLRALVGDREVCLRNYASREEALFVEQEIENFLGITNEAVSNSIFRPGLGINPGSARDWPTGGLPLIDPRAPHGPGPLPTTFRNAASDPIFVVVRDGVLISVHATTDEANETIESLRADGFVGDFSIRVADFR